jgi:hypothetical protein
MKSSGSSRTLVLSIDAGFRPKTETLRLNRDAITLWVLWVANLWPDGNP